MFAEGEEMYLQGERAESSATGGACLAARWGPRLSSASEEAPPCSGEPGEPGRAGPVMVGQGEAEPTALAMAYGTTPGPSPRGPLGGETNGAGTLPTKTPAPMGVMVRPMSLASFFSMILLSPVTPGGKPSGTRQVGEPHTAPQTGRSAATRGVVRGRVPDRPPFLGPKLMG